MLPIASVVSLISATIASACRRWGLYVLLSIGICGLVLGSQVQAAGTVVLQFRDRTLPVPLAELQAFAADEDGSAEIQEFIQANGQNPAAINRWLTTPIIPPQRLLSTTRDFALTQVNKVVGDPLGRGSIDPLRRAFQAALRNDSQVSVLELVERYPAASVRLELSRMERVYGDVDQVLTRIAPVLEVTQTFLPELFCDCNSEAAATSTSQSSAKPALPRPTQVQVQARKTVAPLLSEREGAIAPAFPAPAAPEPAYMALESSDSPALENRNLVIQFGILGRSIPLQNLTRFAETGELSSGWRTNFNLVGADPAAVRTALTQEVSVDVLFLDRTLNTLLGEYLLFQVGQVVQTQANTANIQALRSALVLAAADDDRLSLLEVLQRYPTPNVIIDARELARLGRRASNFQPRDAMRSLGITLEDWLLELQAAAIEDLCTCDGGPAVSSRPPAVPPVAPRITPAAIDAFLPPNWQPVAPHREDHGIIRVVWQQGTPYEMGYQHGQFLHAEIASLGEEVLGALRLAGRGMGLTRLAMNRSYPEVIEECRGLTDATQDVGMTFDACMVLAFGDVLQELFGNTLPNVLFWDGCSQWVATGAATIDGRLYHGSTLDNNRQPLDYIMNNPVVFVRQPNDGLPHVFITYPGVVWPNWGLNVAGMTVGLDSLHPRNADELDLDGRSDVQIMTQVLKTATSFPMARQIMESEPRGRANLIMVADGKSKTAGVFEVIGKTVRVRELQENGVLYVTNHAELSELFERQRSPLSESSLTRFRRFAQLMEPDGVSTLYGQIDPAGMAQIGRDRTHPDTLAASPLEVFDDDASPGGNGSLRQGVYDPDRLLLWVAAGQPPVPENPFVCFSLEALLDFPDATPCEPSAL